MEKYFIKFDYGVKPKNKAEKEALELAEGIDGTLISSAAAVSNLLKEINAELAKINENNKRCSNIKTYAWDGERESSHISIGGNTNRLGICYLRIYTVNAEI